MKIPKYQTASQGKLRLLSDWAKAYEQSDEFKQLTQQRQGSNTTAFNPSIIDRFGKMHIDWSNPNIYKSLLPIGLIGSGIYTFGNSKNDNK